MEADLDEIGKKNKFTFRATRKFRDPFFALLFLFLLVPVLAYGGWALANVGDDSLCDYVSLMGFKPLYSPIPLSNSVDVYDGCLSGLIRNETTALPKCLAFGVTTLFNLAPLNLSTSIRNALESCVLNLGRAGFEKECLGFTMSLIFRNTTFFEGIWGGCAELIVSRDPLASRKCAVYTASLISPKLAPVVLDCLDANATNQSVAIDCMRDGISVVLGVNATETLMTGIHD